MYISELGRICQSHTLDNRFLTWPMPAFMPLNLPHWEKGLESRSNRESSVNCVSYDIIRYHTGCRDTLLSIPALCLNNLSSELIFKSEKQKELLPKQKTSLRFAHYFAVRASVSLCFAKHCPTAYTIQTGNIFIVTGKGLMTEQECMLSVTQDAAVLSHWDLQTASKCTYFHLYNAPSAWHTR
jgi:hypothetical protein